MDMYNNACREAVTAKYKVSIAEILHICCEIFKREKNQQFLLVLSKSFIKASHNLTVG